MIGEDAYRWVYLDVAGGDFTAVFIFMVGAPFSGRYSARAAAGAKPEEHATVNFALYRRGRRELWVHSEYGAAEWSPDAVRIGGSRLERDAGGRVSVELCERTAPWGRAVRAQLVLEPLGPGGEEVQLVPGQPHHWHPRAPYARARVRVEEPAVAFEGRAYCDANRGAELLGRGVPGWRWARSHHERATEILYEPPGGSLRVHADERACALTREPARETRLTRTLWGLHVPRELPAPSLPPPRLLESSPFYARLQAQGPGLEVLSEVADFRRFHRPSVRWMARFRTRVES